MKRFCLLLRGALVAGLLPMPCAGIDAAELPVHVARTDRTTQLDEIARPALIDNSNKVATCRAELSAAVERLRASLVDVDATTAAAWSNYLSLPELDAIDALPPTEAVAKLDRLVFAMRRHADGFESDELVDLRSAAKAYATQLRIRSSNVAQQKQHCTAMLQAALERSAAPTQAEAYALSEAIEILEALDEAPQLIAEARSRWTYPNAIVHINTKFAGEYVARDIEESGFQTANILGTATRGVSSTRGKLELITIPNDRTAELRLQMTGTTSSPRTVGVNGPAVIRSSSTSYFSGGRTLWFDPEMGVVAGRAAVRVSSSIGIRQIDVETRVDAMQNVANRVAWNKANETHAAAEREVERLTAQRIERRLEQETAEPLASAQEFYRKYLIDRALRIDELPTVAARTTSDAVEVLIRQAKPHELAAAGPPPSFTEGTRIGIALHESVFNNASCRAVWGQPELTDEQIEGFSQFATMQVPPALRVNSNSVPWSAILHAERPSVFLFDDGKIDVTANLVGWKIGDKTFVRDMNVRFVYALTNSKLGMTFTRQGPLTIAPADGKPWTAEELSQLVPHMREKCEAMFQEHGRFNSLILPRGDGFGPFGTIDLRQVDCDDGWLVIGYH